MPEWENGDSFRWHPICSEERQSERKWRRRLIESVTSAAHTHTHIYIRGTRQLERKTVKCYLFSLSYYCFLGWSKSREKLSDLLIFSQSDKERRLGVMQATSRSTTAKKEKFIAIHAVCYSYKTLAYAYGSVEISISSQSPRQNRTQKGKGKGASTMRRGFSARPD